ncbi:uncharacterized protein LOC106652867 [Trichogramma pretiosum]|uniref:uncharacterized protein LOC106652867 n=1 Tax=Trichogramma pretiosum TaxID=7493 RepID=UPI0006C9A63D|nr:uncharacterized protein LOC106652867 [Trichogramma pretiosum]
MFRVLFENGIAKDGKDLKCHWCRYNIPQSTYQEAVKHTEEPVHKERAEAFSWDKIPQIKEVKRLVSLTEANYKHLIQNGITFKIKLYHCMICESKLGQMLNNHLESKNHLRLYDIKNYVNKPFSKTDSPKDKENKSRIIDTNKKQPQQNPKGLITTDKDTATEPAAVFWMQLRHNQIRYKPSFKQYLCRCCDSTIETRKEVIAHMDSATHNDHLETFKINKFKTGSVFNKKDNYYFCMDCDAIIGLKQTSVNFHCLSHIFKEINLNLDLIRIKSCENKNELTCLLCDYVVENDLAMIKHLESYIHEEELGFLTYTDKHIKLEKDTQDKNYFLEFLKTNCPDMNINILQNCDKLKLQEDGYFNYYPENHIRLGSNMNTLKTKFSMYKCFLCYKQYKSFLDLFNHYSSINHLKKLKTLIEFKNNVDLNNVEIIEDMVKNLDLNKTNDKATRKSSRRQYKNSRQFRQLKSRESYNLDISDYGQSYISTFIDDGNQNIYNIGCKNMGELQFGASLTFSLNNARFCIPCTKKFPDDISYLYEHLQLEEHTSKLHDILEEEKEFKDNLNEQQEKFSFLDLAKSCIIKDFESEDHVKCLACKTSILNSACLIEDHMKLKTHNSKIKSWKEEIELIWERFELNAQDSWYHVDRFYCSLCNFVCEREIKIAKHLEQSEHIDNARQSDAENKMNVCYACSTCWYGLSDYTEHYKTKFHTLNLKKHGSILPKMWKTAENLLSCMDKHITDLLKESNKVKYTQKKEEKQLIECLEDTVRPVYPLVKAYGFGSRRSDLGLMNSDVDVYLDCENSYSEIGTQDASKKYIKAIKNNFMIIRRDTWKVDKILTQARVPILKLLHRRTHLKCDVSFMSGLGVEKSNLIRNYVVSLQQCRELILFLKKWFLVFGLYGTQLINAYAITWFTIFYLQNKGIFPSVHELLKLKNESNFIDGWNCGFYEPIPVKSTNLTVKDLLQGFFQFYAKFDFHTKVVCPYLGKVLERKNFVDITDLPEEMALYKLRLQTEELELFRFDSPMCIQDPIDLSQNITKQVTKLDLRCFRNYCFESYQKLVRIDNNLKMSMKE